MVGSHHQQQESFELSFNKAKYNALPAELKAILRYAAFAATGLGHAGACRRDAATPGGRSRADADRVHTAGILNRS